VVGLGRYSSVDRVGSEHRVGGGRDARAWCG
jgi:hypothetical protein